MSISNDLIYQELVKSNYNIYSIDIHINFKFITLDICFDDSLELTNFKNMILKKNLFLNSDVHQKNITISLIIKPSINYINEFEKINYPINVSGIKIMVDNLSNDNMQNHINLNNLKVIVFSFCIQKTKNF